MNDTTQADPGALVRAFVDVFRAKDAALFAEFVNSDVVFRNYGDSEVRGRADPPGGGIRGRLRAIGQRPATAAGRCSARRCRSPIAWSSATRRW